MNLTLTVPEDSPLFAEAGAGPASLSFKDEWGLLHTLRIGMHKSGPHRHEVMLRADTPSDTVRPKPSWADLWRIWWAT
jgi:hypothetical protein